MRTARTICSTLLALVPLLVLSSAARGAERPLETLPGYLPMDELGLLSGRPLTLEINLRGAMLRMVGALAGDDDPEFKGLVEGLEAVLVRSVEFGEEDGAGLATLSERFASASRWLDEHAWQPIVRVVEDDDEAVYIYAAEDDASGEVVGMAVIAFDASEAVVVNLVGRIDPEEFGRILSGLDVDLPLPDAEE